jgi:hypothetical protein
VIWGEHGGFLNKLAEADAILQRHAGAMRPRSGELGERLLSGSDDSPTFYDPWIVPFEIGEFSTWCHALLQGLFNRRLKPGQRWGFKEIRYHRPILATFLIKVFPHAKFILLHRDPIELCVSNLLVSYSLDALLPRKVQEDPFETLRVIEDCLYAIVAMQTNMAAIQAAIPLRAMSLGYETLAAAPADEMTRVLDFLDLAITDDTRDRWRIAAGARLGATDMQPKKSGTQRDLGLLNPDQIRMAAPFLIKRVTAQIAAGGVDFARLRARAGQGKYSFVLGDHFVRNDPFSSMF